MRAARMHGMGELLVVLLELGFTLSACDFPARVKEQLQAKHPGPATLGRLTIEWNSRVVYPQATGSHSPDGLIRAEASERYVIWTSADAAEAALTALLLASHQTVIEHTRITQLFQEQKFQVAHAREQDILRVGALAGATVVIFAELHGFGEKLLESVTLRTVHIETGMVRWMGRAFYPVRISVAGDKEVDVLTRVAFIRAQCPVENGWRWVDPSRETPDLEQICIRGR